MNKITIKPVTEQDAAFIYTLLNDPELLIRLQMLPTQLSDWEEAVRFWGDDPDEEDFIVFEDGAPAGLLGINGLESGDGSACIKMVALLPAYQNRHIGPEAVNWLVDYLRQRGYQKAILFTDRDNVRAQKCYQKCGFHISEELVDTMPNGETVERYKMEELL